MSEPSDRIREIASATNFHLYKFFTHVDQLLNVRQTHGHFAEVAEELRTIETLCAKANALAKCMRQFVANCQGYADELKAAARIDEVCALATAEKSAPAVDNSSSGSGSCVTERTNAVEAVQASGTVERNEGGQVAETLESSSERVKSTEDALEFVTDESDDDSAHPAADENTAAEAIEHVVKNKNVFSVKVTDERKSANASRKCEKRKPEDFEKAQNQQFCRVVEFDQLEEIDEVEEGEITDPDDESDEKDSVDRGAWDYFDRKLNAYAAARSLRSANSTKADDNLGAVNELKSKKSSPCRNGNANNDRENETESEVSDDENGDEDEDEDDEDKVVDNENDRHEGLEEDEEEQEEPWKIDGDHCGERYEKMDEWSCADDVEILDIVAEKDAQSGQSRSNEPEKMFEEEEYLQEDENSALNELEDEEESRAATDDSVDSEGREVVETSVDDERNAENKMRKDPADEVAENRQHSTSEHRIERMSTTVHVEEGFPIEKKSACVWSEENNLTSSSGVERQTVEFSRNVNDNTDRKRHHSRGERCANDVIATQKPKRAHVIPTTTTATTSRATHTADASALARFCAKRSSSWSGIVTAQHAQYPLQFYRIHGNASLVRDSLCEEADGKAPIALNVRRGEWLDRTFYARLAGRADGQIALMIAVGAQNMCGLSENSKTDGRGGVTLCKNYPYTLLHFLPYCQLAVALIENFAPSRSALLQPASSASSAVLVVLEQFPAVVVPRAPIIDYKFFPPLSHSAAFAAPAPPPPQSHYFSSLSHCDCEAQSTARGRRDLGRRESPKICFNPPNAAVYVQMPPRRA